jgi:hypothetical protein
MDELYSFLSSPFVSFANVQFNGSGEQKSRTKGRSGDARKTDRLPSFLKAAERLAIGSGRGSVGGDVRSRSSGFDPNSRSERERTRKGNTNIDTRAEDVLRRTRRFALRIAKNVRKKVGLGIE